MAKEFDSFTKDLEEFGRLAEQAMTNTYREIMIEVSGCLVKFSPVLTGRFMANWQMTVGSASTHSLNSYDETGQATLARLKSIASTLTPGQTAYIVNNLDYAYQVEVKGWAVTPAYQPAQRTLAEFDALAEEAIARNRVK